MSLLVYNTFTHANETIDSLTESYTVDNLLDPADDTNGVNALNITSWANNSEHYSNFRHA